MQPLLPERSEDAEFLFELLAFVVEFGADEVHYTILYNLKLLTQLRNNFLTFLICVFSLFSCHVKEFLGPVAQRLLLLLRPRLTPTQRHQIHDKCFYNIVKSVILAQNL